MDFTGFSISEGTVTTTFYLSLRSERNLSLADFEITNGRINSVDLLSDAGLEKTYRVYALINANPNLRYFPFDSHPPIIIEPKNLRGELSRFHDQPEPVGSQSGDDNARMGAHEHGGCSHEQDVRSGRSSLLPRGLQLRDHAKHKSTILKFSCRPPLIIVVSLASLLMKETSRLGLNASMLLAAVLIHWRIAPMLFLSSLTQHSWTSSWSSRMRRLSWCSSPAFSS